MRREPKVALDPWFLTVEGIDPFLDSDGRLDWAAYFGNGNPVEIDVGCGRGMFLVNAATSTPDVNFLGIEIDLREATRTARRLHRRRQPNARVLGADAREVLMRRVSPASVAGVHVYFPDPWWKRRHRRRRVFTDEFVELAAAALKPGGLLHSWTDVEEYFGVIGGLMNHSPHFEALPPPEERAAAHDLDFQTSFERRQRQEGATIHRGLWRRLGP
jgi:tRNA (guanine-N7-)-methyltransferase